MIRLHQNLDPAVGRVERVRRQLQPTVGEAGDLRDAFLVEPAAHKHEKFCRLPESYQPNDPMHRPKPRPVTREQLGLPEDAFIFASFNGNRKITPETIDSWCRILKRAPNSVLWLMANTPRNQANLLKQFQAAGISAKRIIFCPRAPYEEHIDRQQAADIGIDTFPVNGHTTTSEQLWGGLPVLTVKGTNFASRVSESLLRAIDLPELVAADLQAYEDLAVELAQNPVRIAQYKAHLKEKRYIAPLFDAERFCDHLEQAYEAMGNRKFRRCVSVDEVRQVRQLRGKAVLRQ